MWTKLILLFLVIFFFTGCYGRKPNRGFLLDGIYKNNELKFFAGSFPKPWKRLAVDGVNLAYYNTKNHAVMYVTGKCKGSSDASLMVLRTHLLIGFKSKAYEASKKIKLHNRTAIHSILSAELDGVTRKVDYYIFKKNGCLFDLVLISSKKVFKQNQIFFKEVVDRFKIIKGDGIYFKVAP